MSVQVSFSPTHYAICSDGHLMPCVRIGRDEEGLIEVTSPGGMVYSYPEERVLSDQDGRQLLAQCKAEKVSREYTFTTVFESDASIAVRCQKGRSTKSDYLIIIGRAEMRCNCPSWSQEEGCKHVGGLLLHNARTGEESIPDAARRAFDISELKAREAPAVNCQSETVEDKIAASLGVQWQSERPAAMEIAAEDW